MPIPNTKIYLSSAVTTSTGGFQYTPNASGDLQTFPSSATWVSGITDLNGDGIADIIVGGASDDDKLVDAGRIYVRFGKATGGASSVLPDSVDGFIIDGVHAGDMAGGSVGSVKDINGDGKAEILVGAAGMDNGALLDAGAAFVLWGKASGGIDLADPFSGGGKGYVMKGEAAYDYAGTTVTSIGDLNGDGKADIIVGATGNDAGGADAGAAYVVFGKSTSSVVNLANVAAGTGGFKIYGQDAGDAVGKAISTVHDLNGDGKDEILIGSSENSGGNGAAYVVFGKSTGAAVNLDAIAAGTGGFIITGKANDEAGSTVSGIADINGDGVSDILVGAAGNDRAYVVFGKSTTSEVKLSDVKNGVGGLSIDAESTGGLFEMSVTSGGDFNRDGIADIIIGAPHDSEGGFDAGAVYVVWGGLSGSGSIDLAAISLGMGGAKIVGAAGSLTGSSVSSLGDLNGDLTPDLLIGHSGAGHEGVSVLYSPVSWQPDNNIYGTTHADVMGIGYGGLHKIGAGDDTIFALNDNDTIVSGAGNDVIDGGEGADSMSGGTGNDTYYVDDALDAPIENAGEGTDAVITNISYTLTNNVENLTLAVSGLTGTGNALDNTITGSTGNDTIDGALGADTMIGGLGNDTYIVDNAADAVQEAVGGGSDTVRASIDYIIGANIENLTLIGAARSGTGNGSNNVLTGTALNDVLDGAAGNDTMVGGFGDDTYYADSALDVVVENAGAGTDTVNASVNYTIGTNIENLTLTGAALMATGNALDNIITGTTGNNILNGGVGADTMVGGLGDDTYSVDNAGDTIVELDGEGSDTVMAAFDYTLNAGSFVENITLTGTAHHATGNENVNTLTGTSGADTLDGGAGADTLIGGAGDDTYYVDNASDVLLEIVAGGTDTAIANVNYILADNVENLTLAGTATIGTGNASDNTLMGGAAADTLYGLAGNDIINGGVGADTMIGGAGDDTYYVDSVDDIIVEAAGDGIDKVIVGFDYVLADNIESAHITGAAHNVTGNSGNNTISGDIGDDHIDGGEGDDLEIGGDGDDTLVSSSGSDSLAGGEGDDVYVIKGGRVEIEDFIGHDTIDASEATGDSYIDLSGDDISHIEDQDCHLGNGGTTLAPLDVQFLQDLSGSFGDDIANVRTLVPNIVTALQGIQSNSMFGSSTFVDKPVSPFGSTGDWVYQTVLGLTNNAAALSSTYNAMVIHSGADAPEAQIEALMQLALRPTEIGFRSDSARFVVLFTDAPYHGAGDGASGGIINPNNGDAIVDATEDYPLIAQVKAALEAANIIPIFAIAGGYESAYQGLVSQIGRGTVVTLSADSSNVVAAITTGMTAATVTQIEDARGGDGNDTLKGNDVANALTGNNGNDTFIGHGGDDVINGGAGGDTAVFSGAYIDYLIKIAGQTITITDNNVLDGNEGKDVLTGVEVLQFLNATINLSTSTYEGSTGVDSFSALNNNNWTINGLADNDSLKGRDGSDIINGHEGNDTLYGRAGNDNLTGGLGNDKIYGGEGNDIIHYANNRVVEGYDRIYGENGLDRIVADSNNTYIGIQEITGVEEISANGYTGVTIKGSSSDQSFDFSSTTLINISNIDMGAGNDRVIGSSATDLIKGGLGNDNINGGGGVDSLYGGGGADIFNFDGLSLTARDSVRDFSLTDGDVINLQNLLVGYDPVTSAITDFVRITDSGANSYVAVDVDGGLNGQSFTNIARLDGITGLTDENQFMLDGHLTVNAI